MTTGYSERDGFVRLVLTKDDYDTLGAIIAAGFMDLQQRGIRCSLKALECIARVVEGDPMREKQWPDIDKALAELKGRLSMLEVLERMSAQAIEVTEAEQAPPTAGKPN